MQHGMLLGVRITSWSSVDGGEAIAGGDMGLRE